MYSEAGIVGSDLGGSVHKGGIWKHDHPGVHSEEAAKDGCQGSCDDDEDDKSGFGVDVGAYLKITSHFDMRCKLKK